MKFSSFLDVPLPQFQAAWWTNTSSLVYLTLMKPYNLIKPFQSAPLPAAPPTFTLGTGGKEHLNHPGFGVAMLYLCVSPSPWLGGRGICPLALYRHSVLDHFTSLQDNQFLL